eukprot:4628336-Amphidinium_carterae.1
MTILKRHDEVHVRHGGGFPMPPSPDSRESLHHQDRASAGGAIARANITHAATCAYDGFNQHLNLQQTASHPTFLTPQTSMPPERNSSWPPCCVTPCRCTTTPGTPRSSVASRQAAGH